MLMGVLDLVSDNKDERVVLGLIGGVGWVDIDWVWMEGGVLGCEVFFVDVKVL